MLIFRSKGREFPLPEDYFSIAAATDLPPSSSAPTATPTVGSGGRAFTFNPPAARSTLTLPPTIDSRIRAPTVGPGKRGRNDGHHVSSSKRRGQFKGQDELIAETAFWTVPLPLQEKPGAFPPLVKLAVERMHFNDLLKWSPKSTLEKIQDQMFSRFDDGIYHRDFQQLKRS